MRRYFFRFRTFVLTLALGMATSQFFSEIENSIVDHEIRNATIITSVLAPRFAPTWNAMGENRQHAYGYITNNGKKLSEGSLDCRVPKSNTGNILYSDKEKIIYKFILDDKEIVRIYELDTLHCIDGPTVELDLELEQYLKRKPK